jgi:hypothetical protein
VTGIIVTGILARYCCAGQQTKGRVSRVARVRYVVESRVPVERVLAAITDFSERRPVFWPALEPTLYKVYSVGDDSADVQEGSTNPFVKGGVWVREHYDWSTPGFVRAQTVDSNVFAPGSVWELRVERGRNGGSRAEMLYHRRAKNAQGRLVGVLVALAGRVVFPMFFRKTLKMLENEG